MVITLLSRRISSAAGSRRASTARTYASWRQATAGDRTWDVRDDTADQCYGGHSFESARTTAAVASTAGLILTYQGAAIRALYSSANGGLTENVGCILDAERVGDTWGCAQGWPYLQVTDDPAETAAYDKRGGMPHTLWSKWFSGKEIRKQIIEDYGVDIGRFSNRNTCTWFRGDMAADMRLIAIRESALAFGARPHRAHRRAAYDQRDGEGWDHDRRAGRAHLGQVAPHLPRRRFAWIRFAPT